MIKSKKSIIEGPIFFKITLFALPIMLTGILQALYSMADNIVVGKFSGDPYALAAVGSTTTLTTLIINTLLGVAVGTGVVVSQHYGAGDKEEVSRAVHTSLVFSLIGGIAFMILGLLVSRPALILMGTKPEFLDKSHLYISIICLGIPASAIYNFGAAILRSVGDSKTPLFILSTSGLINVGLNVFFVVVFHMSVAGVALATILSQYFSVFLVLFVLSRRKSECYAFNIKQARIDVKLLKKVLRCGIPAGVQSAMFSISNVLLASAVNTFPTTTVTANTIAGNIDGFTFIAINSFQHAAMTFTGQNYGARKYKRIFRVFAFCLIQSVIAGLCVGHGELLFGKELANLFVDATDPNREVIISTTLVIIRAILSIYFLCGIMEVFSGTLRGLGYSLLPMSISVVSICVLRAIWVFTVFKTEPFNTLTGLYAVYPVTWCTAIFLLAIAMVFAWRKIAKQAKAEEHLLD